MWLQKRPVVLLKSMTSNRKTEKRGEKTYFFSTIFLDWISLVRYDMYKKEHKSSLVFSFFFFEMENVIKMTTIISIKN